MRCALSFSMISFLTLFLPLIPHTRSEYICIVLRSFSSSYAVILNSSSQIMHQISIYHMYKIRLCLFAHFLSFGIRIVSLHIERETGACVRVLYLHSFVVCIWVSRPLFPSQILILKRCVIVFWNAHLGEQRKNFRRFAPNRTANAFKKKKITQYFLFWLFVSQLSIHVFVCGLQCVACDTTSDDGSSIDDNNSNSNGSDVETFFRLASKLISYCISLRKSVAKHTHRHTIEKQK